MAATPDALSTDPTIGLTIDGRFRVESFVAAGGMGRVYRATDLTTGDAVALKLLAVSGGDEPRFVREAYVLAKIDHPGVVRYVAHGRAATGELYLAMEWLRGVDLAEHLGEIGTLSVADALALARATAAALIAAHEAGVVHRDLKPGNVFLVDRRVDRARLLDFGVARATSFEATLPGSVIGTPAYMSPEQVRGDAVGPESDVYGLGALLYRCLVGAPPFRGAHTLAVLAKVILESPPSLRELRPDVPRALEALLHEMLAKDPAERPRDGAAVLAGLDDVAAAHPDGEPRVAAVVSAREQRVACVVLWAGAASDRETTSDTANRGTDVTTVASTESLELRASTELIQSLQATVRELGGELSALARGGWLVTIPRAGSPRESAARAVRCALALTSRFPDAPSFVSTGRVLLSGEGRVGDVIDRAAEALVAAASSGEPGGARVDAATADLLDDAFVIEGDGAWRRVVADDDRLDPERTLLGRSAACVGRDRELAMLGAALSSALDESRPAVALVVGAAGLGKTRVVTELLGPARGHVDLDRLFGRGDPIRASSPYALAAQLVQRGAGIRNADDDAVGWTKLLASFGPDDVTAAHHAQPFAELLGIAIPRAVPGLRAARGDPSVMSDALREAWIAWLRARATSRGLCLVVEDAHWADAASLRLLESAFAAATDLPLFIVATARPEGSEGFAHRFRAHGLVELTLAPLGARAAARLVTDALGAGVDADLVQQLIRRSAGHPFHLEELVRAVARGSGPETLPDSVLGMLQARLDELDADARRLLRAASVFGETFPVRGVHALLGDELSEREVRATLARLTTREIISDARRADWPGAAHRFRHMLLRDAAYATLADADRSRAHHRAATWLEQSGETDPVVLGEHHARADEPERAAAFFRRAASVALRRDDFEGAHAHATRARTLGADGPTHPALLALEAEILYWRGDFAGAAARAPSAIARLPRGSAEWFDAVSMAAGVFGQLGRNTEVETLLRDAAVAASDSSETTRPLVALCRGMTQVFWAHHGADLADVRARVEGLAASSDLDAYEAGWVHRVRGESAWLHARDVDLCLAELDASSAAFERARAPRPLCLARLNAASLVGWSGDPARGLELVALARADAERLGAGFLLRYGRAVRGLLLAFAGDPTAESAMREALSGVSGSPRLAFVCHAVIAHAALERGDVDGAVPSVEALATLQVVDDLRAAGVAISARHAIARGDLDEGLALARRAVEIERATVDLELTHGVAGLALAEAYVARGERAAARDALAPVADGVGRIAASIRDPERRRRFWERPFCHDRIVELCIELGVAMAGHPTHGLPARNAD